VTSGNFFQRLLDAEGISEELDDAWKDVSFAYDELIVCLILSSTRYTADGSIQTTTVLGAEAKVVGVHARVEDVHKRVEDVHERVEDVHERVEDVNERVEDIQDSVTGVRGLVANVQVSELSSPRQAPIVY
jgi:methyl-accepting chemotaxis protein